MKKINYKIILGILLLVALVGAVLLVQQKQETRRGATNTTGFIRLSLDENSTTKEVTADKEFTVPLVANVTDAGGVDSVVAYFCYDPTKIDLKDTSDLEKSFTPVDPAQYVGGSIKVKESNNKCVKVTFVSIKQGARMGARVADINFKTMASSGTGTITIDKSNSSLGVAGQDNVDISSVGNLNYSISGETGVYWVYRGSSPCQKSSIKYDSLDACNAADDSKNSCYASEEECNAVTNPKVYCVGTCPAGTAHKTDGVCSNGGTRDDSSCTDVLTSYCGKNYDYNCCTCKTTAVVNGVCGIKRNTCTGGQLDDIDDSSTQYKWNCVGTNGGTTDNCSKAMSTGDAVLDLKLAFAGVKKDNAKCAKDNWLVKIKLVNSTDNTVIDEILSGYPTQTTSVNKNGEVIYDLSNIMVTGIPEAGVSKSAFFLTGPKHVSVKYGENNQERWYPDSAGVLSLNRGVNNYDFSNFPLLAGDVNGDGIIDGRDFSYVKEKMNLYLPAAADGTNVEGDINGDCIVNAGDIGLVKLSLKELHGQTY